MRLLCKRTSLFAAVLALGALAGGCAGDDSKESFEREVVTARNTADSSLAALRRPTSTDDLIKRLRIGRDRVAGASETIAAADAPDDLTQERRQLADALRAYSQEFDAAANSIELVQGSTDGEAGAVQGLVFDTWDAVQAALDRLRNEGIDVEPLRPGGGA